MNWEDALRETWRVHLEEKPEWGKLDCCQFVREYVQKLSGQDFGGSLSYSSEAEAMDIIREHGDLLGLLTSILGEPEEPSPGCVVVASVPAGLLAGVWQGSYVVSVHPIEGVVRFKAKVVGAWSCRRP